MNKNNFAKSATTSVRKPRRAMLLVGGIVAATSIFAGAGPAAAGPGFGGPGDITLDSPTSASCTMGGVCSVSDKNGIVRVTRYKDAWHTSSTLFPKPPTQTTVVNTDGAYVEFEVTDTLGSRKMFKFPVVT